MSMLFTLKDRSPILSIDLPTPIELDPNYHYGLALIGFHTFNSIPNIDETNNKFYFYERSINEQLHSENFIPKLSSNPQVKPKSDIGETLKEKRKVIVIPTGAYEIGDIEKFLKKKLLSEEQYKSGGEDIFLLRPNLNTLKSEIYHKHFSIDFSEDDTLGKVLGYSKRILNPNQIHESDVTVDIVKVQTIHIDSNITEGAFYNNRPTHTIYEFSLDSDPGYSIDEVPRNLIYLPLTTSRIYNITLKVLDQDSELVNFRGEEIIIRLELKRWS